MRCIHGSLPHDGSNGACLDTLGWAIGELIGLSRSLACQYHLPLIPPQTFEGGGGGGCSEAVERVVEGFGVI